MTDRDLIKRAREAIAAWLKKQTTESWEPDYKRQCGRGGLDAVEI